MNGPTAPQARFVDLSRPIESGMPVIPGIPSPRIEPYLSHAASRERYDGRAEFELTRLFLIGNTGTYLDSPYHRYPDRPDLAGLSLASLVGLDGLCVDGRVGRGRGVTVDLSEHDLQGRAVLVRTGWDRRFPSDRYFRAGPFLTDAVVRRLIDGAVAIVGVDFGNVDDTADPARPAHTALLAAGIPIVEHLVDLDQLPTTGFRLFAPVLAVRGAAAMPVRVFAELDGAAHDAGTDPAGASGSSGAI